MKYIIIYNECLRSKIIYSNFLKQNKKKIKCVIRLPININTQNKFYLIKKGILNNNAYSYIFFQIFQTIFYNFFSIFFSSNIEGLCKKLNINFVSIPSYPDKKKLKQLVKNYNEKDIIFASTTYILKHKDLSIKNPVLNLHESDPKKYRGSAIYFRIANNSDKFLQTTIMEPNTGIDTGKVLFYSKKKNIKDYSVFKIILSGYFLQNELLKSLKNKKIVKTYPKSSYTTKSNVYSFPSRELELKIKDKNIKTLSLCNYFFILHLSIIKDIDKLYSVIKKYLNK